MSLYKLFCYTLFLYRQTAPKPSTPAPLIIREKAPTPPPSSEPTIIEVSREELDKFFFKH